MTTNQDSPNTALSEPVAWMYSADREEPFTSIKRWPADVVEAQRTSALRAQAEAEERARIVAWLQREAGKTHECYEHVLLDAADAIRARGDGGGAMDELIARDADLI